MFKREPVIVQPPMADEQSVDAMGRSRTTQVYQFTGEQGKRDSIVVVAQLSPEFTAVLVDRWQELEMDVSSFGRIYLEGRNRRQTEYVLDRELTETLELATASRYASRSSNP